MKKFLLIVFLLIVLVGSFCFLSIRTINTIAVKVDQKTDSTFAVKKSVDGIYRKVDRMYGRADELYEKMKGMVAEGYSEPEEGRGGREKKDR